MYLSHWGMREPPFRNAVDPRQYFPSPTHEEALARLHFLIDGHRCAGLLLGASGTGKSLVLEMLAVSARREGRAVAKLNLQGLDKHEFIAALCGAWGLAPDQGCAAHELWRLLLDRFVEFRVERREALVLLDHADEADEQVLRQVLRLAQSEIATIPAATVVLSARSENVARLGPRLLELADLRIDLAPWSEEDIRQYLEQGLARAGCDTAVFTHDAAALLTHLTAGIPRHVAQLADLALVAAAGQELTAIDASTVESVYAELGVVYQLVDAQ